MNQHIFGLQIHKHNILNTRYDNNKQQKMVNENPAAAAAESHALLQRSYV
jgi:hypothetical protein